MILNRLLCFVVLLLLFNCNKDDNLKLSDWPLEKINQYVSDCMKEGQNELECLCQVNKFMDEFTWAEIEILDIENNQEYIDRTERVLDAIISDCFKIDLSNESKN